MHVPARVTPLLFAGAAGLVAAPAAAFVQLERLEGPGASVSLAEAVGGGDAFVAQSFLSGPAGPVVQALDFRVGEDGIDGLTGSFRWAVGGSVQTVGVNLDLLDAGGTVLASDAFAGVLGGFALSSLAFGPLPEGDYTLRMSGVAGARGFAEMAFQAMGPVAASLAPLPPAPAAEFVLTPSAPLATLAGGELFAGGAAVIAAVVDPAAALDHLFAFTLGEGADAIAAKTSWIVDSGALRLVGLNVDLLGPGGALVASDVFAGLAAGNVAASSFEVSGLAPGDYALRITGAPVAVGDYSLVLEIGGVPPAVVPLPAAGAMAAAGLAALAILRRRRQA